MENFLSKKLRNALVALFFLVPLLLASVSAHAKYASYVVEINTGKVLHQANANTRNYPASLTKMMTLYMLFEAIEKGKIKKNSKITFSKRAAARPSTNLKVAAGYKITVETAIKALIVRSANDVATAVAEKLGGSESKFARLMTKKARSLGMKRTTFKNASGLPNRGQLSTARDMATLVLALQRDFPQYYHYFSTTKFTYAGTTYRTHNRLLGKYKGTNGVKTGYTRASGFNLASSVEKDGHKVIGIIFGGKSGKSRNNHMITLLNKSFAKLKNSNSTIVAQASRGKAVFARAPIPKHLLEKIESEKIEPEQIIASNQKIEKTQVYFAPLLPKQNLNQTIIMNKPKPVSLVQDFRTGDPKYDGGGWSVQVGAYHTLSKATQFFSSFLPRFDGNYESVILSRVSRKGSIYKPRLVGMRKAEAYSMCKQLKAKKIDCLVISPHAS